MRLPSVFSRQKLAGHKYFPDKTSGKWYSFKYFPNKNVQVLKTTLELAGRGELFFAFAKLRK